MNEWNKKFIEDFKDRTSNFNEFDKQVGKIDETRRQLQSATQDIVKFLNDNVMSTATSSLVKTSVILPKVKEGEYHREDCDEIITFNHKGIGTLRVPKDGQSTRYNYGTTFSEELKPVEFLYVVSDSNIRNAIIAELINTKKTKLLKHFNDMCAAADELVKLNDISEQYQKDNKGLNKELSSPQEIYFVKHDTNDDRSYETKLTKFTVTGVQVDDGSTVRLHTVEVAEEEPSYDNEYGKKQGLRLKHADIETAMIYMQFPDELKEVLNKMEAEVTADYEVVCRLKHSIEEKLATYSVLKSLM